MPPPYVGPDVKTHKYGAARAICEVVVRPSNRFLPMKSAEQESLLMLDRGRELLVRRRTMPINTL